tara:strand:- start:695 stop:901 length:207 start_codon:yes stop_codon:yes gene_type:complete
MKYFEFTALRADCVDDRVLNSDGIERSVSKVTMHLTANQIIDLVAQLAPNISSALESESLFSSERFGI